MTMEVSWDLPSEEIVRFLCPRVKWLRYRTWFKRLPISPPLHLVLDIPEELLERLSEKYGDFDYDTVLYWITNNITVQENEIREIRRRPARARRSDLFAETIEVKGCAVLSLSLPYPAGLHFYMKCWYVIEFTYQETESLAPISDEEVKIRVTEFLPILLGKYMAQKLAIRFRLFRRYFRRVGSEQVSLRLRGLGDGYIVCRVKIYRCRKCGKCCWGVYGALIHLSKHRG